MPSFDISQLEPMSLYVVFTKKTSSGLMMGILLTKETLQSDKAEFVLAGNKRVAGGWMRINPVDIKVSEDPIRSFRLHTAVKLNETRLSEEHARSISIKIWPATILGVRDERLIDYLVRFLARVNFVFCSKAKDMKRFKLAKNAVALAKNKSQSQGGVFPLSTVAKMRLVICEPPENVLYPVKLEWVELRIHLAKGNLDKLLKDFRQDNGIPETCMMETLTRKPKLLMTPCCKLQQMCTLVQVLLDLSLETLEL
ncbi:hypothetical protein DFH11DRAFT_1551083 [Phellopilus nigrolimitatus]|nr:hypothetical protein DFH11DRAFT_1551083 [Phellopilus nigrolimitatus]